MILRRTICVLTVILFFLVAVIGILVLLRPTMVDAQRKNVEEEIIQQIQNGQTKILIPDIPEVEGEEMEFAEMESDDMTDSAAADPIPDPGQIEGYGVIAIPAIDLKMPLVRGADAYSLRAAIGWYPESAEMGQVGNCAIFGHRMQTYGRHFNRLDEVKDGDNIYLYNTDGECFVYTVYGTDVIDPGILMSTLREHNSGFTLTLVTCTPTGVGSHRLLVYAQMENSEEMERETP